MTPEEMRLANAWAAATQALSETAPLPPTDSALSQEPWDADMFLAALAEQAASINTRWNNVSPEAARVQGVGDLLIGYRGGTLDPRGVVADLLALAGPTGPAPEAVLCPIAGAEALAEDSVRRLRSGTARPLEGVPFGIKDIIDVAGARVTCGSLQTGDRHATVDATCVARLRAAGAIPLFMLASSEFACGAPANGRYGAVPNPQDRTRWTGGSSTGSAAALAAGIVPLALGTDTGGSIRIPAAFCGITGLKPTRGLVPRTGVATLSWTLDHIGPMARACSDIAHVLPILAGPDGDDPAAAPAVNFEDPPDSLQGLRIGVPDSWFTERCDMAVLAAWRAALEMLRDAGAVLVPVTLPDLALAHEEAWAILYAELASCQESRFPTAHLFDSGTRARIARGLAMPANLYLRAQRRRPAVQSAMLRAMAEVDVLVTPGAGAEAPRLADLTVLMNNERAPVADIAPRNTMIFDYVGFPALMIPSGVGVEGLPVAIQIVGAPFRDVLCLAVGASLQKKSYQPALRLTR